MATRPKYKLDGRLKCDGCKLTIRNYNRSGFEGGLNERSVIHEIDGKEDPNPVDFVFCEACSDTFDKIMATIKKSGLPIEVLFKSNEAPVPRELCPHCRYDNVLGRENCEKCQKPMKKEAPTPTAT